MTQHCEIFRPVLLAWARVQPKAFGRKQCRKFGVGALIRELRRDLPDNGAGPYVDARRE